MENIFNIGVQIAYGEEPERLIESFLDCFLESQKKCINIQDLFTQEPLIEDDELRAYLGGLVEYLSQMSSIPPPVWCQNPIYFLKFPVFWTSLPRDILLANTPSAFRRRLLFCGDGISRLFSS